MRLTATRRYTPPRRNAASEDGFTMIFALMALLISGLLVTAAFTAASGDVNLSRNFTLQTKAYYAAEAGVQRYQHELSSNPNYWIECKSIGAESAAISVPATTDETYFIKTLASSGHSACESGKQTTILETSGAAKGTFRILSTGIAGSGASRVKRSVVATFAHPGFTRYVYESNYEVEDPSNFEPEPVGCEHYYKYRVEHNLTGTCSPIEFAPTDKVNGPLHTNDAAEVCSSGGSSPTFGRNSEDAIEMNGGHYATPGCANEPNIVGKYTESGSSLLPPETDAELLETAGLKFTGRTELTLTAGTPNKITATVINSKKEKETLPAKPFPTNGVIYVENSSSGCAVAKYTPFGSDTENDAGCGNVYVHGEYTESLTIASADDVIVNGNLTTTHEASGEPTGGATLGLIAQNFVRVYHPVKPGYNLEPVREPTSWYNASTEEITEEECGTIVTASGTVARKAEITGISTTNMAKLAVGMEVSGTYIPSGTTITSKSSTSVTLSQAATGPSFGSSTNTYTFYKSNGDEYAAGLKRCIEATPTGYTFHESEFLFVKGSCESRTTYVSKGFCEYENSAAGCSSKATNLNSTEDPNHWGYTENLTIDAAILSTKHSWIVDNYKCGAALGKLNVWGSIAQFWRGPVGTSGGTGYIKNYNYDQRLATQQPPSFLSPSSTSWKLSRETAPPTGFTG